MTSNINYLGINENFPVPGQDNDTQVFRDNFDTIKNSLRIAREEMTDLQDNAARTDLDNDFNNKLIQRAVLLNNADKRFDGGVIDVPLTIDYENGNYQIFRFSADTTLEFQNFPDDDSIQRSVGKVILELYSDGSYRTLSFVTSGGAVIKKDIDFPSTFTLTSQTEPVFIEVWRHSTAVIYVKLLSDYSKLFKEDLSNSSAANLKTEVSYFSTEPVTSPATTETATLAAGIEGQIKTFVMQAKNTADMVITVSNAGWKTSGSGSITFSSIGQGCTLQYINSKWFAIGANGVTFS